MRHAKLNITVVSNCVLSIMSLNILQIFQNRSFSISAVNNYAVACFFSCELLNAINFLEVRGFFVHYISEEKILK